jgi:hypothetical protein
MGVRDENAEHGSQRLWALDERARVRSPWVELTKIISSVKEKADINKI